MPIDKLPSGKWRVRIRRRGQPDISRTFERKTRAREFERRILADIESGVFTDASEAERTTIGQAASRYAVEIVPQLRGQAPDLSRCRRLAADTSISRYTLASLDAAALSGYRDARLDEGASAQTVKHELGLISRVLGAAVKDWGISLPRGNPVQSVRLPRLPRGRMRRLVGDEEERLLEAARAYGGRIEHIIAFASETAMRRGEIAAMKWTDVHLQREYVHIPESKNEEPRDVPLHPRAAAALNAIPRRIDGIVWAMKPDSITQAFDRICERAGIEGLVFHDLRHEGTSRLAQDFDVHELSRITGHKDFRTLRRYYNPTGEELAKKMSGLRG